MITYNAINGPEKTYIHTDKDTYITGETLWYKVYLVDGVSHTKTEKSNVVYIELLNPSDSTVARQTLYSQGFGAAGDIKIPEGLTFGNYTLRAFTKYMLNEKQPVMHTKQIAVWGQKTEDITLADSVKAPKKIAVERKTKRPIINFFPEGGNLVAGIENNLGFKVTDLHGNGIALKGKIVDQHGKMVSPFESYDFGLGKVTYTPRPNHTYYVSTTIEGTTEKYPLPVPLGRGYALSARNIGNSITLKVTSNTTNGVGGTMLIGHIRGRTFFKRIEKSKGKNYTVKILTQDLEDGVAHFTLFTKTGEPVCERLVFVDNPYNDVDLTLQTNTSEYAKREKAMVSLKIRDKKGNPLNGSLSASVFTIAGRNEFSNIKSWLLLNSDIRGTVPNPDFFFNEDSIEKKNLLDAFMMVHGWRRFVWKDLLDNKVSKQSEHKAEKGIMVEGKTTSFKNRYQPKKAYVSFSAFKNGIFKDKKQTDTQGNFSYGPYVFYDSIQGIVEAKPRLVQNDKLAVYLDTSWPLLPAIENDSKDNGNTLVYNYPEKYIEQAVLKKVEAFKYNPKTIRLKEVTVKERKKTRKEIVNEKLNSVTSYYSEPTKRIITDSTNQGVALTALNYLHGVPGVRVNGYPGRQTVTVNNYGTGGGTGRLVTSNGGGSTAINTPMNPLAGSSLSNTGPLFLLDRMPVDLTTINNLNPSDIMFIDVLRGPSTAIYGMRGNGGVIAFYTRGQIYIEDEGEQQTPNIADFKINGFYKAREFFGPNYDVESPKHVRADYRTTLYWNPDIQVKNGGNKELSFFTADITDTYIIRVEGITDDGRPVSTMHSFEVTNGL